jgi:hypothetical protein
LLALVALARYFCPIGLPRKALGVTVRLQTRCYERRHPTRRDRRERRILPMHPLSRRVIWHSLGLIAAVLLAWLIFHGYRQPEFLLELANMRLC